MEIVTQWLENDGVAILFILLGGVVLYFVGGKAIEFFTKHLVRGRGRSLPKKDVEKRQKTLSGLAVAIWRGVIIAMSAISIFRQLFPGLDLSPLFVY